MYANVNKYNYKRTGLISKITRLLAAFFPTHQIFWLHLEKWKRSCNVYTFDLLFPLFMLQLLTWQMPQREVFTTPACAVLSVIAALIKCAVVLFPASIPLSDATNGFDLLSWVHCAFKSQTKKKKKGINLWYPWGLSREKLNLHV